MFRPNYPYLILFIIFLSFGSLPCTYAQQSDSLQVVSAQWNSKVLKKGVVWHQGHFNNLFHAVQEINWIEIDLKKHAKSLHLAAEPEVLKKTSQFALENQALVAINAGFFDVKKGGAVDYIKVNKQVINPGNGTAERADAVLSISGKRVQILSNSPENSMQSKADNILVSGPLLIQAGQVLSLKNSPFNNNRHPRTAVTISKDHKLILFVVDGRSNQSYGMSLPELGKVLYWLGAKEAMNLDGGGSSSMYVLGATENNLVNYPSDNKKFDHEGERSVANIIYLK